MNKIVCLGWGSLIWQPKNLDLSGKWFNDGPKARLEFARQSLDGRITLVLNPQSDLVNCLWVYMQSANLDLAIESLRKREGISSENCSKFIGVWNKGNSSPDLIPDLTDWANTKQIDSVIWTNLPPKFNGESRFSTDSEIINYLQKLEGTKQELAKEYIIRAPAQIRTHRRMLFETTLGWIHE